MEITGEYTYLVIPLVILIVILFTLILKWATADYKKFMEEKEKELPEGTNGKNNEFKNCIK